MTMDLENEGHSLKQWSDKKEGAWAHENFCRASGHMSSTRMWEKKKETSILFKSLLFWVFAINTV